MGPRMDWDEAEYVRESMGPLSPAESEDPRGRIRVVSSENVASPVDGGGNSHFSCFDDDEGALRCPRAGNLARDVPPPPPPPADDAAMEGRSTSAVMVLVKTASRALAALFLMIVAWIALFSRSRDPRVGATTDAPESGRKEPSAPVASCPNPTLAVPAPKPPRRRPRDTGDAPSIFNFDPSASAGARLVAAEVEDLVAAARDRFPGVVETSRGRWARSFWNENTFAAFHKSYGGDLAKIRAMVWHCLQVRAFAGADDTRADLLDRAASEFDGVLDPALWRDAAADQLIPIDASAPNVDDPSKITIFWLIRYGSGALAKGLDRSHLTLDPTQFAKHQVKLFEFRALARVGKG